jgi:hypothetical protein
LLGDGHSCGAVLRHTDDRLSAVRCATRGLIVVRIGRRWMSGERSQFRIVDAQDCRQAVKSGTAGTVAARFVLVDRCRPDTGGGSKEGDGEAGNGLAGITQPLTKAEIGR